jgi:hypothetical protein
MASMQETRKFPVEVLLSFESQQPLKGESRDFPFHSFIMKQLPLKRFTSWSSESAQGESFPYEERKLENIVASATEQSNVT